MYSEAMNKLKDKFKQRYGIGIEVKIPKPVMTIRDDYPYALCSGSNGYISKVRINSETDDLEYYHSWWKGGWFNKGYARQLRSALNQVL